MNRAEFMSELKHKLRRLPAEEQENAVSYYEEYFDEAGPQMEIEIIEKLGSPSNVAAKIIGEYAIAAVEPQESDADSNADTPKKKKRGNIVLIAILAVFASPIALPIAITVIILLFAMGVMLFALVVAGGAMVLAGIAAVVASVWAFTQGFATGLYHFGMGLFLLAAGSAMVLGILQLSKVVMQAFTRWMGKLLIRRGKNE